MTRRCPWCHRHVEVDAGELVAHWRQSHACEGSRWRIPVPARETPDPEADPFLAQVRALAGEPRPPAVPLPPAPRDQAALERVREITRQLVLKTAEARQLEAEQLRVRREPCVCGSGRPAKRCDHRGRDYHVQKVQEPIDARSSEPKKELRVECPCCHWSKPVLPEVVRRSCSCGHALAGHELGVPVYDGRRWSAGACSQSLQGNKRCKCRIVEEVMPARIAPHKVPGGRVDDGRCPGSDLPVELALDAVEQQVVSHPSYVCFWTCKCGRNIPVQRRHLVQHQHPVTHELCDEGGKEIPVGLSPLSLRREHWSDVFARQHGNLFRWLDTLRLLGEVPECMHARLTVGKSMARVWADAGLLLSAESVDYFSLLTISEALAIYCAATSAALRVCIAWLGGCNDEHVTERTGNEWGYQLDGMIWDRGHRSHYAREPKVRCEDVGGDRAGTYSGRHCRATFAELRLEDEGLRKDRRKGPLQEPPPAQGRQRLPEHGRPLRPPLRAQRVLPAELHAEGHPGHPRCAGPGPLHPGRLPPREPGRPPRLALGGHGEGAGQPLLPLRGPDPRQERPRRRPDAIRGPQAGGPNLRKI